MLVRGKALGASTLAQLIKKTERHMDMVASLFLPHGQEKCRGTFWCERVRRGHVEMLKGSSNAKEGSVGKRGDVVHGNKNNAPRILARRAGVVSRSLSPTVGKTPEQQDKTCRHSKKDRDQRGVRLAVRCWVCGTEQKEPHRYVLVRTRGAAWRGSLEKVLTESDPLHTQRQIPAPFTWGKWTDTTLFPRSMRRDGRLLLIAAQGRRHIYGA
jgi:hypothetical protein